VRADVRQRMPTFERALAQLGEDSGPVSGHAPGEAAVDQVFLSFVPFQNPDRNTQLSRVN
jgi:hypothetical protein